ncbi:MAG: hypothetical protein EXR76_04940 [Myxococcales bacterium]|nr:hypothetical protein [Myxococcales bacterium]
MNPLLDFLSTGDLARESLDAILAQANGAEPALASGAMGGCLIQSAFIGESTRTRAALELSAHTLGAPVRDVSAAALSVLRTDDAARALARMAEAGDVLAIRHPFAPGRGHRLLEQVAELTDRPIVNLQSDLDHPLQTLADLLTMQTHFEGALAGRRVALTWVAQPSADRGASIVKGLIELLPRFGMEVRVAAPPGFELGSKSTHVQHTSDLDEALSNAEVVYPWSYAPDALLHRPDELAALAAPFAHWTIDERRFARAAGHAIVLSPLPGELGPRLAPSIAGSTAVRFRQQATARQAVLTAVLTACLAARVQRESNR